MLLPHTVSSSGTAPSAAAATKINSAQRLHTQLVCRMQSAVMSAPVTPAEHHPFVVYTSHACRGSLNGIWTVTLNMQENAASMEMRTWTTSDSHW